eukprot:TRINITY_DN9951_c0_g1_i1.p1 TRINITY_DN9951_c0_g1~~TRINITY_DN9951_c0_g1_i1.p1  ORF type:complete len:958 (+),score=287.12 TRINITY_DN9951_c0_g1_i1:296-2875(+)
MDDGDDEIVEVPPSKSTKPKSKPKAKAKAPPPPKGPPPKASKSKTKPSKTKPVTIDVSDDSEDDGFDLKKAKRAAVKKSPAKQTPTKKTSVTKSPAKAKASPAKATASPSKAAKGDKDNKGDKDDREGEEDKPKRKWNYADFKRRESAVPPRLGEKDIPTGALNCLGGLKFVLTGLLESLEREKAAELIKDHGGTVQQSVSKRVNYIVAGEEPGPSKMAKAKDLGLSVIDEDGLFELIKSRPAQDFDTGAPKSKKAKTKPKATTTTAAKKSTVSASGKASESSSSTASLPPNATPEQLAAMLWVDKHAPRDSKKIIGQGGAASNANKLKAWLTNWQANLKKKPSKLPAKSKDGAEFQAVLMVGAPGIGKTTTATLVCRECGYEPIELNASDVRSKRLLHEKIGDLTGNTTMTQFYGSNMSEKAKKADNKVALIFDEVDGMAGNEDRGGVGEIIKLIASTKIPIICIANEVPRKLLSLKAKCFNLSFSKPREGPIVGAMMTIAVREGIKINPIIMRQIVEAANCDIRQILNNLYLFSRRTKNLVDIGDQVKSESKAAFKDLSRNVFQVVDKFFAPSRLSMHELTDCFFVDYGIMPLFVQENYLKHRDQGVKDVEHLERIAKAADAISEADLLATHIQSNQAFKALPMLAAESCIRPGFYMRGRAESQFRPQWGGGMYQFPQWLGKMSTTGKHVRYVAELQQHMRMAVSADRRDMRLGYIPFIRRQLNAKLAAGADTVSEAVEMMDQYYLTRGDFDLINELDTLKGMKEYKLETSVKRAFTNTYKKEAKARPFDTNEFAGKKKKRAASAATGLTMEGDDEIDDDDDEDEVVLKPKAGRKATSSKGKSRAKKASSSARGRKK